MKAASLFQTLLAAVLATTSVQAQTAAVTIAEILSNTKPLPAERDNRFPLLLWHLRATRENGNPEEARTTMQELASRGLVVVPGWNVSKPESLKHAVAMAREQNRLGLPAYAFAGNAGAGFYRSAATHHIDGNGEAFTDRSHNPSIALGCPFEKSGWPAVAEQLRSCVRAYIDAGVRLDGLWFDWEGDGPSEWNDAWAVSKRCVRCRRELGVEGLTDFTVFQKKIRRIRSAMQKMFVDVVHEEFPEADVANYGVHPQGPYRHWWDWYERMATDDLPARREHRAVYRHWYDEFPETGFTIGMPVIYGRDRIYAEYTFDNTDYRWFYDLLVNFSDAASHRPDGVPLVPFVNRFVRGMNLKGIERLPGRGEVRNGIFVADYRVTEDAPPNTRWLLEAKRAAVPMTEQTYRELLWHMWLRGADGMYVWSPRADMLRELVPVHEVYAEALKHRVFLEKGKPVTYEVPAQPGTVTSALRLGNRLLIRRTDFGGGPAEGFTLKAGGSVITVPPSASGRTVIVTVPAGPGGGKDLP